MNSYWKDFLEMSVDDKKKAVYSHLEGVIVDLQGIQAMLEDDNDDDGIEEWLIDFEKNLGKFDAYINL